MAEEGKEIFSFRVTISKKTNKPSWKRRSWLAVWVSSHIWIQHQYVTWNLSHKPALLSSMWRTLLLFYFRTCRGGRSPAGCTNTFGTERKWHRGKLRSAPCLSTFSVSWHKPWEREGLCFCCCVSQGRKGGELCGVTGRKHVVVSQLFISEERRSNLFCLTPQNVLILPPSPWSIRWTVHASASVLSSQPHKYFLHLSCSLLTVITNNYKNLWCVSLALELWLLVHLWYNSVVNKGCLCQAVCTV